MRGGAVKILMILIAILGLSGTAGSQEPKNAEVANFKLKDFKFEVEEKEYNVTYKGKGLLVAQSPAMQEGRYFVFLKARDRHTMQVASELIVVILSKGVGELNITMFYGKSERPAAAPQFIWEAVGYVPLLPAAVSMD
jgi:hypothetical protein